MAPLKRSIIEVEPEKGLFSAWPNNSYIKINKDPNYKSYR
jgi:hypothetical protein